MQLGCDILMKILCTREKNECVECEKLKELFDLECYRLLEKIIEILKDDQDDEECFWRIERIVSAFKEVGNSCGGRHDF